MFILSMISILIVLFTIMLLFIQFLFVFLLFILIQSDYLSTSFVIFIICLLTKVLNG